MNWETLKKEYVGIDRAVFIMQEYMKLGSYKAVADKHKTDRFVVASSVSKYKKELEKQYPKLYKEFRELTKNNYGKERGRRVAIDHGDWKEVKKKHKGIDLARFVMQEACELGGLKSLEIKYNVLTNSFSKIIHKYREEMEYKYPSEVERYVKTAGKRGPRKGSENKDKTKKEFKPEYLEILESEILDSKFLNYITKFNTGELSGIQLITMAKEKGVKVYELTDDGKRKFIV